MPHAQRAPHGRGQAGPPGGWPGDRGRVGGWRVGGRASRGSVGRDRHGAGGGDQEPLAVGSGPLIAAGPGAVVTPSPIRFRPMMPSAQGREAVGPGLPGWTTVLLVWDEAVQVTNPRIPLCRATALTGITNVDRELMRASPDENPDVFDLARVGLGALGILTNVTYRVEPLFPHTRAPTSSPPGPDRPHLQQRRTSCIRHPAGWGSSYSESLAPDVQMVNLVPGGVHPFAISCEVGWEVRAVGGVAETQPRLRRQRCRVPTRGAERSRRSTPHNPEPTAPKPRGHRAHRGRQPAARGIEHPPSITGPRSREHRRTRGLTRRAQLTHPSSTRARAVANSRQLATTRRAPTDNLARPTNLARPPAHRTP